MGQVIRWVAVCVCLAGLTAVVWQAPQSDRGVAEDRQARVKLDAADETARAELSAMEPSVAHRVAQKGKKYAERGPKRYDEPQEAMDFFLAQRLSPGQAVLPLDRLQTALKDIREREAIQAAQRAAGVPLPPVSTWAEIGPGNIGGRTRAIVINPINPNVMYAAGVAGGVWKSTDAGASWTATDDFMLNIAVSTLAMDPNGPDVLYAGTGEGFFNSDSVRGLGIFKTVDGAATWTQLTGTVDGTVPFGAFFRVNDIVISPASSSVVYAATRYGVWKSVDAGASWFVVLQNPDFMSDPVPSSNGSSAGCMELAIRTDTAPGPDILLASFGSFDTDGLFRTVDSGVSWTQVGTSADLQVSNQGRMALAIAPSDNDVVYVSMVDNGTGNPTGTTVNIFRSVDGGVTWSPRLNLGNPFSAYLHSNVSFSLGCFGSGFSGQGWYDNVIAVDPVDSSIVWVGGIDLFRSEDGGQNFGIASYWFLDPSDPNYVHADHHALVFHPDYDGVINQTLYSGSDGGLARTDNARDATSVEDCPGFGPDPLPTITWTGLNNGYAVTQFYHGDTARDADVFAGGTQDNGTLRVQSAATPLAWEEIIGGDGGYFQIDPTDSQIMYGETQRFPRIRKSTDGGNTFSLATNGITDSDGLFITPFAMDRNDPEVLWTGGSRPWRTTNGAGIWENVGPNFSGPDRISAVAIAPTNSNVVYLGFNNGYVVKTTDGLAPSPSWTIFDGSNGLNTSAWVSSLAVDPTNADVVYATYSTFGVSHVLKSADGGVSWAAIDGGIVAADIPEIPVHWISVRPCNPQQLIVGTELGVFQSEDGGTTWVPGNIGLANTVVETLAFQDDYRLIAFTHGRGAFRAELTCPCDPADPVVDCNNNSQSDECDLAFGASLDCNGNQIPDECDAAPGGTSDDCNENEIPDECEPDCNANGVVDECDVDPADPDGNTQVSADCNLNLVPDECEEDCNGNAVPDDCDLAFGGSLDCNANGFPDECDVVGGGVIVDENFESGAVPGGWSATGIFQVTSSCGFGPLCDGSFFAYAGSTGSCTYGDNQFGELTSPPVLLGPTESELRFCHYLDSEFDYDFAEVFVNGLRVFRESGSSGGWQDVTIDLDAFRGQLVNIVFRFSSDAGVSGILGWQVDRIQVESGSGDCNTDQQPDECAPDDNANQIPDVCEGACCDGVICTDQPLDSQAACELGGGTFFAGQLCGTDCQPDGITDLCQVAGGAPDCNADQVPDECQLAGNDCDGNGVPDECDPDGNNNGVPDACDVFPPLPVTSYPDGAATNRYIAFAPDPAMLGEPHGYEVRHVGSGAGWYISSPRTTPASIVGLGLTFLVSDPAPILFDFATLPAVHVGGCLIASGETYEVRATLDGVLFADPLAVSTAPAPTDGRWWADVVGVFSASGNGSTTPPTPPGRWTPPNGLMNGFDITALIQKFQQAPGAPFITWVDLNGEQPDRLGNGGDILQAVNAFSIGSGREFYPFNVPDAPGPQGQGLCPAPPLAASLQP